MREQTLQHALRNDTGARFNRTPAQRPGKVVSLRKAGSVSAFVDLINSFRTLPNLVRSHKAGQRAPGRARFTRHVAPRIDALDRVQPLLSGVAGERVVRDKNCLIVLPQDTDGLSVALMTEAGRCTVVLGAWYDDFPAIDTALEYFEMAIRGELRLRIDSFGRKPVRWAIERHDQNGEWTEINSMCLAWIKPNGNLTSTYRHNTPRVL